MTEIIHYEVKDNKPHIEHKNVQQQLKKDAIPTSLEEIKRAKKARENAHTIGADIKREISMDIKNKLSESFEFIEESCGSGAPEFEFFDAPQSQTVHEGMEGCAVVANKYPIIGKASGVFAPIGVMSRNNRIYDEDHYDYLFTNQQLVDRIAHRGMLGTIGHHDKKVDDQDLADGKVSHIVSDLHIQEEADGTRNLYGTLEILDTPAGHLLKTYYDSGIPLFVSSRGGGNLLPVPHESYKRVDKTKYFLETFDIVKNPGFLQAKPVYEKVTEGVEEMNENQNICEVSDKTVEKVLDKRDDQMVQSLFKEGGTEVKPYQKAKELADKRAERQGKEIVQNDETGEHKHVDKIDKLAEALTNFVNSITEAKKEDKVEDGETKEAKEKKEAKEAKEAKEVKEAKEAKIEEAEEDKEDIKVGKDEDKKDKEEKTPEDEKKEEAEDAIADTVSEDEKEDKAIEKGAMEIIDPHKGLNKKDIANGRVQLNLLDLAQAKQIHKDGLKNQKDLQDRAEEHIKAHPHQELPKKEEVAKQLRLGLKENLKSAIQKYAKGDEWHKLNLEDKAADIQGKELKQAMQREGRDKVIAKRVDTKNEIGSKKTDYRRPIPNENIKEESEYDKNMKIANDYDKLMMKQPAQSPDGSKNSVANYYQTKYQEYFDKAMQARHAEQAKSKKENIKEEVEAQLLKQSMNEGYNLKSVVDRAEKLAKTGTLKNGETYSHAAVNNDIQRQKRRKEILSNDDKRHAASYVPDSYMYKRGKISGKVEKDDIFTTTNQKHGSADELAMQRHSSETLKNKAIGRYCKKMNDKNSKIEQALKTIAEADQMLAQPVAPVQTGEIYKNAQDAENKPELPTTFDHQDLARALKANYKNTKEENK